MLENWTKTNIGHMCCHERLGTQKGHTLQHCTMVSPGEDFPRIFVWYSSLKVKAEAPFSSAVWFSVTAANELKNGSCILPGSVSSGSAALSMGKWIKRYNWPTFFKNAKACSPACYFYGCSVFKHTSLKYVTHEVNSLEYLHHEPHVPGISLSSAKFHVKLDKIHGLLVWCGL